MLADQKKMVPPDGGWGWVVVIGVSIVNFCTRSMEPSFGLLFGDLLKELDVETTGAALIMSTLDALINFSGLFVGPLIRALSYRKVALMGSLLSACGFMLTYPAKSMAHILATYSIINGLGVGLTASSTFVALNHYFVNKRSQALGFSLVGTAFGMMVMPQAVRLLLETYGFRGSILILGAMFLNSLAGSLVLQPAKWHYIPEVTDEEGAYHQEMETIKETDDEDTSELQEGQTLIKNNIVKTLEDLEKQSLNVPTLTSKGAFPRNLSALSFAGKQRRKDSKESIMSSYSRLDFTGSSLQLHLQPDNERRSSSASDGLHMRRNMSYPGVQLTSQQKMFKDFPREPLEIPRKPNETVWHKIVVFMDLDLLRDPVFLNLLFGLSVFYVAEQNFKMVAPFFFLSLGYDKLNTATFLSVQAFTDICARLILPPICDRLTCSKRTLFMSAILLLGIFRSVLAHQSEWGVIMGWLVLCGFVRGAALINFTITISEYSSLEKLPAAFGLHMVGKGLFVVCIGPVLGKIRDITGSYPICIHSQTFLILLCVIAWSTEYIIMWVKSRNKEETESDTTTT